MQQVEALRVRLDSLLGQQHHGRVKRRHQGMDSRVARFGPPLLPCRLTGNAVNGSDRSPGLLQCEPLDEASQLRRKVPLPTVAAGATMQAGQAVQARERRSRRMPPGRRRRPRARAGADGSGTRLFHRYRPSERIRCRRTWSHPAAEQLAAVLAQGAVRTDVAVEGLSADAEFAAKRRDLGFGGVVQSPAFLGYTRRAESAGL